MELSRGLSDFTKKPIYYIISDFAGQFVEEYPTGTIVDWGGDGETHQGFINYTGEYVLLIKIDSFNNILNEGVFSRVDNKILNDLQCDRVKVCFYLEEGGAHDSVLNKVPYELLQKELLKFNIDESNIVYSDNNFILETEFKKHYPDSKIKVVSHNWQLWRYVNQKRKERYTVNDFLNTKDTIRDKHFLSYNRSPHSHRCAAILYLFENGFHKKGILSFPSETIGIEGNKFSIQEEIDRFYGEDDYKSEEVTDFKSNLPFIADVDSIFLEPNRWDSVIIESSFINTYFSFVVGTWYESYESKVPYTILMTEKVYKPLTNFHPVIYLGNTGSLKKLKEVGFKTFHPYIDESYDEEPNGVKRLHMVMEQVNKLCSMELTELNELYWSMSDILISNYDVYHKMVHDRDKSNAEYILNYVMG
jgi:hypothetical protein|tara:strand:- start:396 stop:1649 length:1254 start_codon:yes stop_codon:yes gene_type:complete